MSLIEFRNTSKWFGDCISYQDLSFSVEAGTIHGLVGENGAGKSTAMKTLFGIYPPDAGEIFIRGKKSAIKNPIHAMKHGIGMVHQHFMLAPSETVIDNIILGHEPKILGTFLNHKKARKALDQISNDYGLQFKKWDVPVSELSVGEQQRVEIIKLLYQKSEVLILDEPTAVLTPQEVKDLFQNLRRLKTEGKTIILISHKLKEVLEFTDNVTVMRRGAGIGTQKTSGTTEAELAQMMVGREVSFTYQGERKMVSNQSKLKPILEIKDLSIQSRTEPIRSVSFQLKPNEILGIAGIQGNGQTELLKYLSHPARFRNASGEYLIRGKSVIDATPLQLRAHKIGLVPEDRLAEGLLLQQDMRGNFLLGQEEDSRYAKFGMIKNQSLAKAVEQKISEFDIRPTDPSTLLGKMSGGNQQKLVIARSLDPSPEVLLVAHPTRGVDVGAIEKIHESIVHERNLGRAVFLFSSELDELIDLSDRILVFFGGEIRAEFSRREFDPWTLGRVMGGGDKDVGKQ
jgi:ABC-type uncharacterized transport system ATPase subunit